MAAGDEQQQQRAQPTKRRARRRQRCTRPHSCTPTRAAPSTTCRVSRADTTACRLHQLLERPCTAAPRPSRAAPSAAAPRAPPPSSGPAPPLVPRTLPPPSSGLARRCRAPNLSDEPPENTRLGQRRVMAVAAPRMAADDDSSAPPRASGAAQRGHGARAAEESTRVARAAPVVLGSAPTKEDCRCAWVGGKAKRWGRARRREEVLAADAAREEAGAMVAGRTSK